MQIATFLDRPLDYDETTGRFTANGRPLPVDRLRKLSDSDKITWNDDDTRRWFYATFTAQQHAAGAPAAAQSTPHESVQPGAALPPETLQTRRCAKCEKLYPDEYDSCPRCAEKRKAAWWLVGYPAIVFLWFAIFYHGSIGDTLWLLFYIVLAVLIIFRSIVVLAIGSKKWRAT